MLRPDPFTSPGVEFPRRSSTLRHDFDVRDSLDHRLSRQPLDRDQIPRKHDKTSGAVKKASADRTDAFFLTLPETFASARKTGRKARIPDSCSEIAAGPALASVSASPRFDRSPAATRPRRPGSAFRGGWFWTGRLGSLPSRCGYRRRNSPACVEKLAVRRRRENDGRERSDELHQYCRHLSWNMQVKKDRLRFRCGRSETVPHRRSDRLL